ncbi:protein phosphatase 2C domain-containing protein [Actinocatenispora rupis]|uniref:Protein phosphatase 2C n=1 Tax=Actinocatenispora rupis TaxID=519421 RepID=A0A8J3JE71_9ACTN|nr:protein phosphatase 2C domain-containing protein [Actinocatenispora rupis]GID14308.1 hypothetical protein Aru02nite_51970 [Actinocatenispora rupis]
MLIQGASESRPGHENEDLLATADGLVVVLDGCGTPDSLAGTVRRGCRHGVPWYVRSLGAELVRLAAAPGIPLADALAEAIGTVTDAHRDTCDLTNADTPACTVAMLRDRGRYVDHLVLSDSTVALAYRAGDVEVISDDRLARVMPRFERHPLGSPERADRDRRSSAARTARLNRPDGFWVASTDPAAAAQALTGTVPAGELRGALVATDGGVRLVEFGELTWPTLLDIVAGAGPADLIARTRAAEAADPTAERFPRGKQYDDATVAWCTGLSGS